MHPDLYREMAENQREHWWFRARREILERVIARLALPERAEVLEIGAGTGANLAMLKRYGHVSAVEMDAFARQHASAVSGVQVAYGRLPDTLPLKARSFDLICLFDVLEHIEDDCAALTQVRRLLKPGGRAVVTVPAYQWMYGAHDRAHHHVRRYTAQQVYLKARGAGLAVTKKGYFNTLLFPIIALRRIHQKIAFTLQDTTGVSLPNRFVNSILYNIFSVEKYILPAVLFPYGTSVLAILARDRSGE